MATTPWCRLWADMPNDPKWRTIARTSDQSIGNVIAVFLHMMNCASTQTNASERGFTHGWNDEDVASALDLKTEQVAAIRVAMQGRVLDGAWLKGWDRRQPIREDEKSAARGKAFREREKLRKEAEQDESQDKANAEKTEANASKREKALEVEVRGEVEKESRASKNSDARATRLPADWSPSESDIKFCTTERKDLVVTEVAKRFVDYWISIAGPKARKTDWSATWRNWVRSERAVTKPSAASGAGTWE